MKLFMEIDPQLFDQCSHDYTESQETAGQREQMRQDQWDRIAEQAKQNRRDGVAPTLPSTTSTGSRVNPPPRIDEVDPMTRDSQQRLDALRIQDEGNGVREPRRAREADRQNEVRGADLEGEDLADFGIRRTSVRLMGILVQHWQKRCKAGRNGAVCLAEHCVRRIAGLEAIDTS